MRGIIRFLCIVLFFVLVWSVYVGAQQIDLKLISVEEMGEYVFVRVRAKNISDKHINQARITCILLDSKEKELTFETHYVIKSAEGGLPPGQETYFTYSIRAPYNRIKFVKWHIERLVFR